MADFAARLSAARELPEIFELVKDGVLKATGKHRAGLMLGLAEMGLGRGFWIGAFYGVGTNMIIMNETALRIVKKTRPKLSNVYSFVILMHEYLHSLGNLEEANTRAETVDVCVALFGEGHLVTEMARDTGKFFPELRYASVYASPMPGLAEKMHFVKGFDQGSVDYIR